MSGRAKHGVDPHKPRIPLYHRLVALNVKAARSECEGGSLHLKLVALVQQPRLALGVDGLDRL
eukprot:6201965-Pleurochrysis_carterae.AAC.1